MSSSGILAGDEHDGVKVDKTCWISPSGYVQATLGNLGTAR